MPFEKLSAPEWIRVLQERVVQNLAVFILRQRWFRSKDKKLIKIEIEDILVSHHHEQIYLLLFLRMTFQAGAPEIYFSPLVVMRNTVLTEDSVDLASLVMKVRQGSDKFLFFDALSILDFRRWLLEQIVRGESRKTRKGIVYFYGKPDLNSWDSFAKSEANLLDAEQSNTSLVINGRTILKIFRKIECGINPEVEMLNFLTESHYAHVPSLRADMVYERSGEFHSSVGVMRDYIKCQADGWNYALDALKDFFGRVDLKAGSGPDVWAGEIKTHLSCLLRSIERLGQLTGELHRVLSREGSNPLFQPEPVTPPDMEKWQQRYRNRLQEVLIVLGKKMKDPRGMADPRKFERVLVLADPLEKMAELPASLCERGIMKIRCHGDYHLGQVLRGERDWFLFDFEGEPLRSIQERKQKDCALKDVAGMLRSFNYVVCVAASEFFRDKKIPGERTEILKGACEDAMRDHFLKEYFAVTFEQGIPFLSSSPEENRRLLSFFELEKAVYELDYELNNRPQWVDVPIEGIERSLAREKR